MVHCVLLFLNAIYDWCFRCLRIYATNHTPLFQLETLPSGTYRKLKCCIDLRKNCCRNLCITFLISFLKFYATIIVNNQFYYVPLCSLSNLFILYLFLSVGHFYFSSIQYISQPYFGDRDKHIYMFSTDIASFFIYTCEIELSDCKGFIELVKRFITSFLYKQCKL